VSLSREGRPDHLDGAPAEGDPIAVGDVLELRCVGLQDAPDGSGVLRVDLDPAQRRRADEAREPGDVVEVVVGDRTISDRR
jgi:hypothetical protein